MALSNPSVLNTTALTTSGTSIATGASISPTGSALLVVAGNLTSGANPAFGSVAVADTLTGTGAWSVHVTEHRGSASGSVVAILATATAGSAPGSGTVTLSWSGAMTRRQIQVMQVTGQHATPFVQGKGNQGTANSLTITFDDTPATDSLVIATITDRQATAVAHDADFTEITDVVVGGDHVFQSMYDKDSAAIDLTWTTLGALRNAGAAIEIAAAAAAAAATRTPMYARRRGR